MKAKSHQHNPEKEKALLATFEAQPGWVQQCETADWREFVNSKPTPRLIFRQPTSVLKYLKLGYHM